MFPVYPMVKVLLSVSPALLKKNLASKPNIGLRSEHTTQMKVARDSRRIDPLAIFPFIFGHPFEKDPDQPA